MIKYRRLRWAGHAAEMEDARRALKILTNKPSGRLRRRPVDNIKMDLKEIRINVRNWLDSAQDSYYLRVLGNEALKLRVI